MTKEDFESATAALPEGVSWGDPLTPEIARGIGMAWADKAAETFNSMRKTARAAGNVERAYIYADVVVRIRAIDALRAREKRMSAIKLTSSELLILRFDNSNPEPRRFRADDVEVSIVASENGVEGQPDLPALGFCITTTPDSHGEQIRAIFDIDSYEEIDLLRRYCEMTLELFRDGRLD